MSLLFACCVGAGCAPVTTAAVTTPTIVSAQYQARNILKKYWCNVIIESVHARVCSRSAGPFLMAKSSMLLCVGNNQGSLLPAPYLDTWGEEVRLLVLAV
jgi:hypothetical protein